MKKLKALGFLLFALSLFIGCAEKQEISNQTALYWHKQIMKDIQMLNFDGADDKFTSLEIEHPNSEYIPIDLLNLYKAHLENGEYKLAEFYLEEYIKRYSNRYEKEWGEYQIAKTKFLSLENPYTNQKKIIDTINYIDNLLKKYPNSKYNYELNSMKEKLIDTKIIFNNRIAKLYQKLDKPKAVKVYKTENNKKIIPPYIPWYKNLFYW